MADHPRLSRSTAYWRLLNIAFIQARGEPLTPEELCGLNDWADAMTVPAE
jgi:hypothetical protein